MYTKNNLPTALKVRYVPFTMANRNGPPPSPVPPSAAGDPGGPPASEPAPQPGAPAPSVPAEPAGPVVPPVPTAPAASTPVTTSTSKEPKRRFLFISKWGLIHDLAWEVKKEGNEVRYHIMMKSEREVAEGFVATVKTIVVPE